MTHVPEEFLKTDVFFLVTTVAVIVLGTLLALVLWRIFRILGRVEEVSRQVRDEGERIGEDISALRKKIKEEGVRAVRFKDVPFFGRTITKEHTHKKQHHG